MERLSKIRGHFEGTQASAARLLQATEATLAQHKEHSPLQPTDYYAALSATLQTLQQDKPKNKREQLTADTLQLLGIIADSLPANLLRAEAHSILNQLQPILDQAIDQNRLSTGTNKNNYDNSNHSPLRHIINYIQPIYRVLTPTELLQLNTIPLRSILPLITDQQPKLRRAAQSFFSLVLLHPPVPLQTHPYLKPVIQFSIDQLNSIIPNYQQLPEISSTLIISLLKFIQSFISNFPLDHLDPFIHLLLNPLSKLNNPFITTTLFNTLESLFGPSSQLDHDRLRSTISSISNIQTSNPIALAAKLNALEHGWICLARVSPQSCSKDLPELTNFPDLFQHFADPNQNVREAAKGLLAGICRYCITDQEIATTSTSSFQSIRSLTLLGLASSDLIAVGGTVELIAALKSLAIRLRNRPQGDGPDSLPYAARLLKDHILALDKLRTQRIGIQAVIDDTLECMTEICGPAFILETLPLNLNLDNDEDSPSQGRAWLLTVIKVFNSSLGHFTTYFIPLSEKLFEKKRDALKLANSKQTDQKLKQTCLLQVKVYDTLIDQIWRLLPGYCDLPWDLEVAFNRSFAELLTQVIYSQPSLRPSIFNSLKILVDKTYTLSKRSLPTTDSTSSLNEFGFNTLSHLNHLKTFAANFLSVLFNVYNSSYDSNKNSAPSNDQNAPNSNRGYMVDCMRSILEILPEKELNDSYQKIKTSLDQSIKSKSQSTITIQKMLDLLIVLLPRLISSSSSTPQTDRLREIQRCICQDVFLLSSDANVQKKSYKLLTIFVELVRQHAKISVVLDDVGSFVEKLVAVDTAGKVSGSAKRDRALLVSEVISIIPSDKLHYIPKLLTEVVLGCKETNSEVRIVSYDGLIKIGRKMKEHGGKIDWKSLLGDIEGAADEMKDVEKEATIEEYFKMIAAGLAGTSPHMVSATIAALSRVLFEFHNELSQTTLEELIATIEIFLNSPNREIAKTAIGFMKVAVVSLPKEMVEGQLERIVPGLLKWASEHKNYFKTNIQNLLERLLRKFGFPVLERFVQNRDDNDGGRKLVYSLNKKQNKKKKKGLDGAKPDQPDDDQERPPNQARLDDAYEEALYGSNSSSEGESEEESAPKGKKNPKKSRKSDHDHDNNLLEDDEDEIMNLLDGGRMTNRAMAGKMARAEKRKQELHKVGSGYQKDASTGKMIIEAEAGGSGPAAEMSSTNAYLEAINGEDSFKRDARGNVKFAKKRKQTGSHERVEDAVEALQLDDPEPAQKKKARRVKEPLGAEFKAKKAGGDRVAQNGKALKPFAYLPLTSVNSKKKHAGLARNVNITGKVKGSKA